MRRILIVAVAAVVVSAAAAGTWAFWNRNAPTEGVGSYRAELGACRSRFIDILQHPEMFQMIRDTLWHQGGQERLLIGGLVRMLGGRGQPTVFRFECLVVDGDVLRADIS